MKPQELLLDHRRSIVLSFLRKQGWLLLGIFVVALYFGSFVLPGLGARFNDDDSMNIYYVWSRGGWALIKGLVLFFTTYFRPIGELFFLALYKFFGLNPFPYHIAITVLLLINVALAYRCAALLSGSRIVGGLCAIFVSYHPDMAQLVYLPAFVFDVLCFTFFFAALVYYLRIRSADRILGNKELLILMLLYIAALESKEMAVTLPVMLLIYEVFWHPPSWSVKGFVGWVRSAALPSLAAGLLTAVYIAGKSVGEESLLRNPQYHPTASLNVFLQSQVRFFKELFYLKPQDWFITPWLIMLWILLAYIAYRRRDNCLKWATLMTVVAPLPIALIPGRGGACLYIPWFGWALWLATLGAALSSFVSKDPLFRHLRPNWAQAIPLLLIVAMVWGQTDVQNKEIVPDYQKSGELFWSLEEQLGILLPKVKPGTQIAFYNDGTEFWYSKFITELFFHDRSVNVRLHRKAPLSPEDFNEMDYVLNLDQQKLTILKRPGEPFHTPAEIRGSHP